VALGVGIVGGCGPARGDLAPIRAWLAPDGRPGERTLQLDAALATPNVEPRRGWAFRVDSLTAGVDSALCRGPEGDAVLDVTTDTLEDFDARVRVRLAARDSENAGLAFRRRGPEDYYLVRTSSRNNNLRLYRHSPSGWALLGTRDLAVPVGQWHELDVRAQGSRLTVGLNGEPLFEARDDYIGYGGLALWAAPGDEVCFADLRLAGGDRPGS
jgi:hypothetical protein